MTRLKRTPITMIGQWIKWTSQGQGKAKTKVGQVMAFVPAGQDITDYMDPKYKPAAYDFTPVAQEDRFLVKVKLRRTYTYYMPRASLVLRARTCTLLPGGPA